MILELESTLDYFLFSFWFILILATLNRQRSQSDPGISFCSKVFIFTLTSQR